MPELGFGLPDVCAEIDEDARGSRVQSGSDFCVLDGEQFFVRAVLPVPVFDAVGDPIDGDYCWGVWTSLSESNFARYRDLFDDDPPADEGPYFGWLSNRVPGYDFDGNLKLHVHLQGEGQRPRLELEETDHPLALHQRNGMPLVLLLESLEPFIHE